MPLDKTSETIKVSHGVIVDESGRVLLLKRSEDRLYAPGQWCWPGGKIEAGEAPEDALRRELREELDAEVEVIDRGEPYHLKTPQAHWEVFPFLCRLSGGFTLQGDEHREARWVRLGELQKYDYALGVRPTLERLGMLLPREES